MTVGRVNVSVGARCVHEGGVVSGTCCHCCCCCCCRGSFHSYCVFVCSKTVDLGELWLLQPKPAS
jgi:hypothetical protein